MFAVTLLAFQYGNNYTNYNSLNSTILFSMSISIMLMTVWWDVGYLTVNQLLLDDIHNIYINPSTPGAAYIRVFIFY